MSSNQHSRRRDHRYGAGTDHAPVIGKAHDQRDNRNQRTISVSDQLYTLLRAESARSGKSISRIVTTIINVTTRPL